MKEIFLILLLAPSTPMYAQIFSFGVKGGIPVTNTFPGNPAGTYFRRYVVGPTAEVHLPFHLAFEVDALYRRSGLGATFITYQFGGPPYPPLEGTDRSRVDDWQVPFLAKWEPGARFVRPFIDGGVTYRHVSGQTQTQFFSVTGTVIFPESGAPTNSPNTAGVTVGGGFAVKLPVIHVWPEIRYTHWPSPPAVGTYGFQVMSANQVDVLVGITF
ncbi:MAG TPA: outer membrane beta-barrel protein [Bryobacteraceae bacterium]|jgi:hypothetical protein|nr:outer membrane beta-barrel protein [Bryobacteraceae bacterium]